MQRIRVRRTTTPGEVPGGALATYEPGELALNLADGVLYFGSASGTPTPLPLPIIPPIPQPAAPTALVGVAAIAGSALTYMRSDAAPALNLAIAPTWTGAHTFSAATTFNGTAAFGGNATFTTASFSGAVTFNAATSFRTNLWHLSTPDNAQRFYFVTNGTTHFKAPITSGNAYTFRNGADTDIVTINAASGSLTTTGNLIALSGSLSLRSRVAVWDANDGYLRLQDGAYSNGVYTPGRFRADSWVMSTVGLANVDTSRYLSWNDGTFTYGTAYIAGSASGGYSGYIIHDGGMRCTLMSNGSAGGIYNQGDGKWLLYRASTTAAISSYTIDAPAFNVSSARALKQETGRLSDVRAMLARLRPILYRLIEGDTREQAGFIAEEVHEVCPFLSDGKTVCYDRLAVLLLADWQAEHGIVTDG